MASRKIKNGCCSSTSFTLSSSQYRKKSHLILDQFHKAADPVSSQSQNVVPREKYENMLSVL